jgi:hypothetical protein
MKFYARILRMIKAFVGRWWVTRHLHFFIFQGEKIRKEMGINRYTYGGIVLDGVKIEDFKHYLHYILRWPSNQYKYLFHKLIFRFIKESKDLHDIFSDLSLYIDEAKKEGYIMQVLSNRIKLENKGREIYVWYYPLLKLFTVTFVNTNIKSIVIAAIILGVMNNINKIIELIHKIGN